MAYRLFNSQSYVGNSSDTKPGEGMGVGDAGCALVELDTMRKFIWDGTQWRSYSEAFTFGDPAALDAFGKQRISVHHGLFESKALYGLGIQQWHNLTNGTGASIVYDGDKSEVLMTVGTASGEYAIRQSREYISYIAGESHSIIMTGVMGAGKQNCTIRIGYFDDNDGIGVANVDGIVGVFLRSSTSGSAVTTFVGQSSWSVDKLDGTGPSGITFDSVKGQIYSLDFQWLGEGSVRFFLNISGKSIAIHEIHNANLNDTVYMATPNLPVRYEITNTGETASPTTMKAICAAVVSEGGYRKPGFGASAHNGIALRSISARTPLFAVREKTTFRNDTTSTPKPNRRKAELRGISLYNETDHVFYEIVHVHDPSSIVGTWSDVAANSSSLEMSKDISSFSSTAEHIIHTEIVPTAAANKGNVLPLDFSEPDEHRYIYQNYDATNSDMFVIYGTPLTATATCSVGMHLRETE